jgi:2,3-bisphosphoglycerate-dependent phosphoglycerate mutase
VNTRPGPSRPSYAAATVLGLPITSDARLRERCLGVLEGTDATAIHPTVSGLRAHRVVDADARPAGGESLRDFYRRVAEFADDLPALGDIAVVAHGGTVRMLNAYLRRIPVERMSWEPLANGSILRSPAWRGDHTRIHENQSGR